MNADVLVIGAGPAGIATAAELRARGMAIEHVDRQGEVGGAYARVDPDIRMSSPARRIALPGLPLCCTQDYILVGEYRSYLVNYADAHGVAPERADVARVEALDRGFCVRMSGTAHQARVYRNVVVATGMFDHPVWPEIPGLAGEAAAGASGGPVEVVHASAWRTAGPWRGKRVLVVGGATSAVEVAETCASRGAARVVVSARSARVRTIPQLILGHDPTGLMFGAVQRLPRWVLYSACEYGFKAPGTDISFHRLHSRGRIRIRDSARRVSGRRVWFETGDPDEFDTIVVATGYRFATGFLPADVARTRAGHPRCIECQSLSHPGLFFVGFPCAHKATSQYLYGIARDSALVARRIADHAARNASNSSLN